MASSGERYQPVASSAPVEVPEEEEQLGPGHEESIDEGEDRLPTVPSPPKITFGTSPKQNPGKKPPTQQYLPLIGVSKRSRRLEVVDHRRESSVVSRGFEGAVHSIVRTV